MAQRIGLSQHPVKAPAAIFRVDGTIRAHTTTGIHATSPISIQRDELVAQVLARFGPVGRAIA